MGEGTKVEWCDATINCFWGCLKGCSYCQARSLAHRFGRRIGEARGYPPDLVEKMTRFDPVWLPDQLNQIPRTRKHSRFFVSFMGDPFGDWNPPSCVPTVFAWARAYYQHTFIMLTKQPQNLRKFNPFPDNVWPGVSVTNQAMHNEAIVCLDAVQARVKAISYEPLLEHVAVGKAYDLEGISWVIVGRQTPARAKTAPQVEWVREIVEAADRAGAALFLKDNLKRLLPTEPLFQQKGLPDWATFWEVRQEFPRA